MPPICPKEIAQKITSGDWSNSAYSIEQWENMISPFKIPQFRKQIKYGSRAHGYVYDEIIPLIVLGKHISPQTTKIQFLGPKQSSQDGIIFHESLSNKQQGIQCVTAKDGQMDKIRHEKIKKYGRAEAYGNIAFSGSKHKRNIPEELKLVAFSPNHISVKNPFCKLIWKAIYKKLDKKFTGLWLLVRIDDFIPYNLSDPEDLKMVKNIISYILNMRYIKKNVFKIYEKVIFVGNNTEVVIPITKS